MNEFLKGLVTALVGFFGAVLTFLIANESGMGNTGSSLFAGVFSGLVAALGFQFGSDEWKLKSWLPTVLGGVIGGVVGGILFAFGG